jgi:hypothetical protein
MHERYPCRMCINLVYRNGQYSQNCAWRRDLWNVPTPSPLPALLGVYKQKTVFLGPVPLTPPPPETLLGGLCYQNMSISISLSLDLRWVWYPDIEHPGCSMSLSQFWAWLLHLEFSMISDANLCSELTMISELMVCDLWAKVKVYSDPLSELSNSYRSLKTLWAGQSSSVKISPTVNSFSTFRLFLRIRFYPHG